MILLMHLKAKESLLAIPNIFLVKDGPCLDRLCFTWMSHQLYNSQRKRLGTIFIAIFRGTWTVE